LEPFECLTDARRPYWAAQAYDDFSTKQLRASGARGAASRCLPGGNVEENPRCADRRVFTAAGMADARTATAVEIRRHRLTASAPPFRANIDRLVVVGRSVVPSRPSKEIAPGRLAAITHLAPIEGRGLRAAEHDER